MFTSLSLITAIYNRHSVSEYKKKKKQREREREGEGAREKERDVPVNQLVS